MAVMTNASCLIVSDPDFRGQDQCTPFLLHHEAVPGTASAEVLPADAPFSASVPLRSCALTLDYVAHVFVDGELKRRLEVPPSGLEIRSVSVLLGATEFDRGCHQVEVWVSSDFSANLQDSKRPGDLASVTWWFTNDKDATFESCRRSR